MSASLESMNATVERWAEPEIHRLHGYVLEHRGAPASDVEDRYRLALAVAQRMGAGGFEARANDSLGRWLGRLRRSLGMPIVTYRAHAWATRMFDREVASAYGHLRPGCRSPRRRMPPAVAGGHHPPTK